MWYNTLTLKTIIQLLFCAKGAKRTLYASNERKQDSAGAFLHTKTAGAIKAFLSKHHISEDCLCGGLYLDKDRLEYILSTDSVDLIDAKMLTRFCYEKNIDGILEFASPLQRWFVIQEARVW